MLILMLVSLNSDNNTTNNNTNNNNNANHNTNTGIRVVTPLCRGAVADGAPKRRRPIRRRDTAKAVHGLFNNSHKHVEYMLETCN